MSEPGDVEADQGLTVRRARPGDREVVLEFCAHTWDGGDYIEAVWDEWMADKTGAFLVAELDGRPVAITHMLMVSDDEAWMEGMRVDPAVRRQGVGAALTSRALVVAREAGAVVARLITGASNTASQRLVTRFGLTRVAEVVDYRAQIEPGARERGSSAVPVGARITHPGVGALERIWEWLEQSNLSPFNGGLEFMGWTARGLTEWRLRDYLAAGQVWLLEEWDTIQALAVVVESGGRDGAAQRLEVRYLDGLSEAISRLALTIRLEATRGGLASVRLWLPDLLILADAMDAAGYTHDMDGAMWVYARAL